MKQSESALMNAKAFKQQNSSYNFLIINPNRTTQIKVTLRNTKTVKERKKKNVSPTCPT